MSEQLDEKKSPLSKSRIGDQSLLSCFNLGVSFRSRRFAVSLSIVRRSVIAIYYPPTGMAPIPSKTRTNLYSSSEVCIAERGVQLKAPIHISDISSRLIPPTAPANHQSSL